MMLTGQSISGSEAVRIGLANEAFKENELFQKVAELAGQMARKSPMTIKAVLHLLQYAKDARYEEGIEEEARKFKEVFGSEDASEGIAAFLEKRKPFFQGK
jgi:enoyl-CoA hydratase